MRLSAAFRCESLCRSQIFKDLRSTQAWLDFLVRNQLNSEIPVVSARCAPDANSASDFNHLTTNIPPRNELCSPSFCHGSDPTRHVLLDVARPSHDGRF